MTPKLADDTGENVKRCQNLSNVINPDDVISEHGVMCWKWRDVYDH